MDNKVIDYLREQRKKHLAVLCDWLKIPSISADPAYDEKTAQAGQFTADHLTKIGLENITKLPTSAHDVIYGEWLHATGKPTLLIYGHYDVQPPDPLDEWKTPPFEPVVQDGYIRGRGTADDKGQAMMILNAIEAWLATEKKLPVNIKVVI